MELPWICPECKSINMVEMGKLSTKPMNKIRSAKGYVCEGCGTFNTLYFTTSLLEIAFEKLDRMDVNHKDFYWRFAKTLKKAIGIQKGK